MACICGNPCCAGGGGRGPKWACIREEKKRCALGFGEGPKRCVLVKNTVVLEVGEGGGEGQLQTARIHGNPCRVGIRGQECNHRIMHGRSL